MVPNFSSALRIARKALAAIGKDPDDPDVEDLLSDALLRAIETWRPGGPSPASWAAYIAIRSVLAPTTVSLSFDPEDKHGSWSAWEVVDRVTTGDTRDLAEAEFIEGRNVDPLEIGRTNKWKRQALKEAKRVIIAELKRIGVTE